MEGIYYHTDGEIIEILEFYDDNEVVSNYYSYVDDPAYFVKYFNKNLRISILKPGLYPVDKYTDEGGIIKFTFNNNGTILTYKGIRKDKELIFEINNKSNDRRYIKRFSNFNKFPKRTDNVECTQEFYPIILLPNKIIENINNPIENDKIYKFLEIKKPTFVKLKLPDEPQKLKYEENDTLILQGDGCLTISKIPILIFCIGIMFSAISSGNPQVGLLFLGLSIFSGYDIFSNLKTVKKTKEVEIPDEIYYKSRENFLEEKREIDKKNLFLEKEYQEKLTRFENQISSKRNQVEHQIYLFSLKPLTIASRSIEEVKRGKTELFFLNKLFDKFGNQIKVDMAPTDAIQFYFPDFTFICKDTGLHIDIEIDEPYSLLEKKPIHHTETNDDERNRYFLEQNWCVIRFSERQIVKETDNCIELLQQVISCIHNRNLDFKSKMVTPEKRWTYEESLVFTHNDVRNKY